MSVFVYEINSYNMLRNEIIFPLLLEYKCCPEYRRPVIFSYFLVIVIGSNHVSLFLFLFHFISIFVPLLVVKHLSFPDDENQNIMKKLNKDDDYPKMQPIFYVQVENTPDIAMDPEIINLNIHKVVLPFPGLVLNIYC